MKAPLGIRRSLKKARREWKGFERDLARYRNAIASGARKVRRIIPKSDSSKPAVQSRPSGRSGKITFADKQKSGIRLRAKPRGRRIKAASFFTHIMEMQAEAILKKKRQKLPPSSVKRRIGSVPPKLPVISIPHPPVARMLDKGPEIVHEHRPPVVMASGVESNVAHLHSLPGRFTKRRAVAASSAKGQKEHGALGAKTRPQSLGDTPETSASSLPPHNAAQATVFENEERAKSFYKSIIGGERELETARPELVLVREEIKTLWENIRQLNRAYGDVRIVPEGVIEKDLVASLTTLDQRGFSTVIYAMTNSVKNFVPVFNAIQERMKTMGDETQFRVLSALRMQMRGTTNLVDASKRLRDFEFAFRTGKLRY